MGVPITTAEKLLRAGDIGRCELVQGQLIMMNPTGGEHGRISYEIAYLLGQHVRPRKLGTIFAAETGFILSRDPDTVRAPDVAFVRAGRGCDTKGFIPGAPDLAVEVLSPDDRPGYVKDKVAEWLEAGASAVWVVDPRTRTVTVHEPRQKPQALREGDTLRAGGVLPGFELAVREIFGPAPGAPPN
jgi:Uma2 family endonuclease